MVDGGLVGVAINANLGLDARARIDGAGQAAIKHPKVVEAMLAGADTFMSKPITMGEFDRRLWIAGSKRRSPSVAAPAPVTRENVPAAFEIDERRGPRL